MNTKVTSSTNSVKTTKPRKAPKAVEIVEEPTLQEQAETETVKEIVEEVNVSFRQRLEALIQANLTHMSHLKTRIQELRKLQREHELIVKDASKKNKKKKLPRDFTKPRRPTGFAEPVIVSDELYTFLIKTKATMKDSKYVPTCQAEHDNWPRVSVKAGLPVARTDITSHISKYIKDHNLQNPEALREIIPDAALKKLFSEPITISKLDPTKKAYTYLTLQKVVNHHFPQKTPS